MTLVADLRLRFGATRLPARVYLPSRSSADDGASPVVLWLAGSTAGDALPREISAIAAAVVLELAPCRSESGDADNAALGWAAEHAREIGGGSDRILVAGQRAGAARAARLAINARDRGWPVVRRQVLVRPAFSDSCRAQFELAGTAPATIVTTGSPRDDGRRYAAALRDAGVEVQEFISDARRGLPLHELARAVR